MTFEIFRKYGAMLLYGILLGAAGCTEDTTGREAAPDGSGGGDDQPEYDYVTVEYRKWQNGSFNAWSTDGSSETRTVAGMNRFTPVDGYAGTAWGGRLDHGTPTSVTGTEGFFRIAKIDGRWYFLDPDGGAVILHGTQHVRPGSSDEHAASFASRYGSNDRWSRETGELLASNGFNYISYGSNRIERFPDDMRDNLLEPGRQRMAYAENLYLLRTFMWDMTANLGYAFEDGTYNRLVLAFEPTFADYVENLAREKCAAFVGDNRFVGYYLDNELPFVAYQNADDVRGVELKHFLALPDRYRGAREFAEAFMEQEGIASTGAITEADREKFRAAVADHYYRVTSEAVRKADPQHLILGSRLHDWSKYTQGIVQACARYCDVVSVNYYARWQPEDDFLANLVTWSGDKPFIVTEFYVKGADASYQGRPYANTEGGGWLVRTQRDRGLFYQNFCLRLLENRNCAGWMHFEYNDGYGGTSDSNKGVVSVEYEPYSDFLELAGELHRNIYPLIDYYDAAR